MHGIILYNFNLNNLLRLKYYFIYLNRGFNIAPWDVYPIWHFGIMQRLLLGLITGLNGQEGPQFGIHGLK